MISPPVDIAEANIKPVLDFWLLRKHHVLPQYYQHNIATERKI
jgi:hypothetical protein